MSEWEWLKPGDTVNGCKPCPRCFGLNPIYKAESYTYHDYNAAMGEFLPFGDMHVSYSGPFIHSKLLHKIECRHCGNSVVSEYSLVDAKIKWNIQGSRHYFWLTQI